MKFIKNTVALLSIIFCLFLFDGVKADSLKLDLLSENEKVLSFNIAVDELQKTDIINVYEGTIVYPSADASVILVKQEGWEVYFKEDNGKIRFLAYNLTGYAVKDESILKFDTTLNSNKVTNVKITLDNVTTSNGVENVNLGKVVYNYKKVVEETKEPEKIEVGKEDKKEENKNDVVNNEDKKENSATTKEESKEEVSVPDEDLTNNIDEETAEIEEVVEEKKEPVNEKKDIKQNKLIIPLAIVISLIIIIAISLYILKNSKSENVDKSKKTTKKGATK